MKDGMGVRMIVRKSDGSNGQFWGSYKEFNKNKLTGGDWVLVALNDSVRGFQLNCLNFNLKFT